MADESSNYWATKYGYADSPEDVQSNDPYIKNVQPQKVNEPPPGPYGAPEDDEAPDYFASKYGYEDAGQPPIEEAPPPPPEPEEPTAADYGRVAMGGLASTGGMAAGLGEYLANMVGADKARDALGAIRKAADDATEYWHSGMSAAGKRDLEKKYATTGENAAWKDLDSVMFTIIASAPSTIVTLGPAGQAAKAAYAATFAKTAGNIATKKAAATAAAAKAATVTGAATEGALGAGGIASDITKTLEQMKPEDLQKLAEYKKLKAANPNMSEEDIRKGIIANATRWNAAIGGVLTGVIGAAAGPMEAKLFTGEAGGFLSRFGRGALVEGAQEGMQAPAETIPTNIALEKPLTEGLLENTIASIVGGAGMGGPFTALGGGGTAEEGPAPPPGPVADLAAAPPLEIGQTTTPGHYIGQIPGGPGAPPGAAGVTVEELQNAARSQVAAEGGDMLEQELAAADVGVGAGEAQDAHRAHIKRMQKLVDEETAYAGTQEKEDQARQRIQDEAAKRYVAGLKQIQEETTTEAKRFELAEKIREAENKAAEEKTAAQAVVAKTAEEQAAKQERISRADQQWNALLQKRAELGLGPAPAPAAPVEAAPAVAPQPAPENAMQAALRKATEKIPKAQPAPKEERIPEVGAFQAAANEAATSPLNDLPEPTEAQKEAGNYRKGHVRVAGLDVTIENPAGSTRKGPGWTQQMKDHYGYIRGTESAEGKTEQLDVFIGKHPESQKVFVVDQIAKDGSFDEHKVLVGYPSEMSALRAYKRNYPEGFKVGPLTTMALPEFKEWLKSGDQTSPLQPAAFAAAGRRPASPVRRSKKEVIQTKRPRKGRSGRRNLYRLPDAQQEAFESKVRASAPADVMDELEYLNESYEEGPDLKLALEDAIDIAETEGNKRFLSKLRKVGISVGMYREVTDSEIERTVTMGGKPYDFTLAGRKYKFSEDYQTVAQAEAASEEQMPLEAEPLETPVKYRLGENVNSSKLASRLNKDGDGFTVDNATGKDIEEGYAVATNNERKISGIATPADIEKYRQDNAELLSQPDHFLGGWVWEGNTYLDISKVFPKGPEGRLAAVLEGKKNAQIAIQKLGPEGGMMKMENYGHQADVYFNEKALENARRQNFLSRETLVYMPTDKFLDMAEHLRFPDQQKAREVAMVLEKFDTPFDSLPHLSIENNGDGTATVVGHEGRHRAMELKRRGIKNIPVVLLSTEGGKGEAIRWQRWIEEGRALPRTLINQNKRGSMPFPVDQKGKLMYRLEEDEKDGRDFKNFFSAVTKGMTGTSSTGAEYTPVIGAVMDSLGKPRSAITRFAKEYAKHRGNFDDHIAFSIPGFKDVQQMVGSALSKVYTKDNVILDIGASEGSFVKSVTALSGMRSVALDPNPDMRDSFNKTSTVPGSEYSMTALGTAAQEGQFAWQEGEEDIYFFDPAGQRYDVVHEAMVFQFISNERSPQISRVKELLKPGGVFITEEKLFTDNQAANEAKKNKYKGQFFEKKDLDAKSAEVLEGMHANMVEDKQLEAILQSNFKYVTQFWDSGNFKGYMASDSKANLDKMVKATGNTKSDYSTVDTPRALLPVNLELEAFLKDSVVKHVVYHGTNTEDITKFKTPAYFTDEPGFAYRFTNRTGTENIMPVVINITNPYRINGNVEGRHFEWTRSEIKEMKAKGYDGVIIETAGEADIYTVFNPTQVKSAVGNVGTYNPKSANILLRQGSTEQTESPLFKKWFGNSKVVNEDGTPMVVYRGEYDVGERAGQIQTKIGTPTFTDAPGVASVYAMDPNAYMDKARATGAHVIPAYISMQNPIDLRGGYEESVVTLGQLRSIFKGSEAELYKILRPAADFRIDGEMIDEVDFETADGDIYTDTYKVFDEEGIVDLAKKHGYDGFIYWGGFTGTFELHEQGLSMKNIRETEEVTLEIRPFSQNQIKSAVGNVGAFNAENIDILLRKGSQPGGVSAAQARQELDTVLANMSLLDPVILEHPGEAPDAIASQMRRDGALGSKGVFDTATGTVYIFTRNHSSVADIVKTLMHEGVAHKGLRLLYPNENEFNALRDDLYANIDDQAALKEIARKYGLDLTSIADQRTAAEEYVASKAENDIESTIIQKVISAVRAALRRLGVTQKWTDEDIRALLRSSRRNMKGKPLSKVRVPVEGNKQEQADVALRQIEKRKRVCETLRECILS